MCARHRPGHGPPGPGYGPPGSPAEPFSTLRRRGGAPFDAPCPPDLLAARTQGLIGTLMVRTLRDVLSRRTVVPVITHT